MRQQARAARQQAQAQWRALRPAPRAAAADSAFRRKPRLPSDDREVIFWFRLELG
jgi:hypothetical protein